MFPPLMRTYLRTALDGTPDVLETLLESLTTHDPFWDFSPDPDRFTLREIVAHLADLEPGWRERIVRTRDEDRPSFARRDIRQAAIDHDYAHSDPVAQLAQFRAGRAALTEALENLSETAWERIGLWETLGPMPLAEQAAFVLAHDGYHTSQIARWLALARWQDG